MATHHIKCHPDYFGEVIAGRKPFEIRFNDRNYKIGDTLVLMEYSIQEGATGRECRRLVSYILSEFEGLRRGWVAMGLAVSMPASALETPAVPMKASEEQAMFDAVLKRAKETVALCDCKSECAGPDTTAKRCRAEEGTLETRTDALRDAIVDEMAASTKIVDTR